MQSTAQFLAAAAKLVDLLHVIGLKQKRGRNEFGSQMSFFKSFFFFSSLCEILKWINNNSQATISPVIRISIEKYCGPVYTLINIHLH